MRYIPDMDYRHGWCKGWGDKRWISVPFEILYLILIFKFQPLPIVPKNEMVGCDLAFPVCHVIFTRLEGLILILTTTIDNDPKANGGRVCLL